MVRLKGDVSAEDAVEQLEDTPWVNDGEDKPHIDVVEDGREIWGELVPSVNSLKYARKRRKVKARRKKFYRR